MRQINVPVEDLTYLSAKAAAKAAGMSLKVWVDRTLRAAAQMAGTSYPPPSPPPAPPADPVIRANRVSLAERLAVIRGGRTA